MSGQRTPFGQRLHDALAEYGPLCVGLDPHPALLRAWGLPDDPAGLQRFSLTLLDAVVGQVGAVKVQSAFFERHGARGIAVLERVLAGLAAGGTLSILDAKRGDIGSTMSAYAAAYLGPDAPLAADALTLSPYLGYESLRPAIDLAGATGRGVFVLALTSNPEGGEVQRVGTPSVAARVARAASREPHGGAPLGHVGLVVGATGDDPVGALGPELPTSRVPVLAPGVGAQGATAADCAEIFADLPGRVLVPVSRGVLGAGPSPAALHRRVTELGHQLSAALG